MKNLFYFIENKYKLEFIFEDNTYTLLFSFQDDREDWKLMIEKTISNLYERYPNLKSKNIFSKFKIIYL